MNKDLRNIATWLNAYNLILNILKSENTLISSRQFIAPFGGNSKLEFNGMSQTKCLGLQIDEHLTWYSHVYNSITKKVVSALVKLKRIKRLVTNKNLMSNY